MLGFNHASQSPRNDLYQLAAAIGCLLGVFLLAGASGHLTGVWPLIVGDGSLPDINAFMLLLPGLVLTFTAVVNLFVCYVLWSGKQWAVRLAFIVNLITAIYFANLIQRGIADHPIGYFLVFVASQVIVLGAIQAGLIWPAAPIAKQTNDQ